MIVKKKSHYTLKVSEKELRVILRGLELVEEQPSTQKKKKSDPVIYKMVTSVNDALEYEY